MTKIKICGLSRIEDIAAVNRRQPDYIGFVFAESRRRVTAEQARILKAKLDTRIKAVGVFTNEPPESMITLCDEGAIDVIQLHGDETEDYIRELKKRTSCPVIKAVQVKSGKQLLEAQKLPCDMLLLDTFEKGRYGGSGKTFDHSLIPALEKPFFLAGGLRISNIEEAIAQCHPYAVDISSGVETNGLKDEDKIRRIIEKIRSIG